MLAVLEASIQVLAVLEASIQHFLDVITGVTLLLLGEFVVQMTDAHEGGLAIGKPWWQAVTLCLVLSITSHRPEMGVW